MARCYNYDYTFQHQCTKPLTTILKIGIEQGLKSPPTQYRLSGRQVLQVKKSNQQHQSTEGKVGQP